MNKVKLTISGIQTKIARYTQKQENTTTNEDNHWKHPELTQTLELAENDIKALL